MSFKTFLSSQFRKVIPLIAFSFLTVTATTQPVVTPPTFVPTVTLLAPPTGHVVHFMSPTGSDAANGLTPATAWATPNHALSGGDVIIAAAGRYTNDFSVWGTVSSSPSTTGGIDGAGGIYPAILLCGGSDLSPTNTSTACIVDCSVAPTPCNGATGIGAGMSINKSNWAVSGWVLTSNNNASKMAYEVAGCVSGVTHHNYILNSLVYDTAIGYTPQDCGNSTGVDTFGADYQRVVGVIAEHANLFGGNDPGLCTAAIVGVSTGVHGTATDTHYFFYNNFAINNVNPACDSAGGQSDGEAFMWDTIDNHGPIGKYIIANSLAGVSSRWCIHNLYGNATSTILTIREYNNTCFNNSERSAQGGVLSEIDDQYGGAPGTDPPWIVQIFNNIMYNTYSTTPLPGTNPAVVVGFNMGGTYNNSQIGGQYASSTNNNNIIHAAATSPCPATFCDQSTTPISATSFGSSTGFGTNTYISPDFKNTSDFTTNHLTTPACGGFDNTTKCMGWNANTHTMTSLSVLDDLTPNATGGCSACVGGGGVNPKGFQLPSTTCVSSGELFNDYPSDMKGLNVLKWNSSTQKVEVHRDLATKPCGM